jgi:ribosomal protein S18 acetylase RimI-like enzyme
VTPKGIIIVDYSPRFGRELVKMWRESFERAVGVTDPHTLEEQLQYLDQHLVPENRVDVVLEESTSKVIGFMASTIDTISQLYLHVDHQNRGIGSMLLDIAKRQSSGRLRLFTFKVNTKAQRFYERHGFRILRFGFEKEWGLGDIEYEWLTSDLETKAC